MRNYDIMNLENRVFAMDGAKIRNYDIFDIEKRIHELEINGGGGSSVGFNGFMYAQNTGTVDDKTFDIITPGYYIALISCNNKIDGDFHDFIDIETTGEIIESDNNTASHGNYHSYNYINIIKANTGDTITFNSGNNDRTECAIYFIGELLTISENLNKKDETIATSISTPGKYILLLQGNNDYTLQIDENVVNTLKSGFSGIAYIDIPNGGSTSLSFNGGGSFGSSTIIILERA